jgi:tRNA nucleotidyltransferase (CCA-adding enzyme)
VRDRLLGYPSSERDWVVVGATPEEMLAAGFRPVGRDFPVFLHPETGEEYALARTERKSGRGYHGFIFHTEPTVTLEQDLARRDLTINAIAETEDGQLADPFDGRTDLQRKLLRHISPAFAEDPLRVLRTARFAARYHHLGFTVADETLALIRQMVTSGEVDHLVPERIWKETERALQERNPEVYFQLLQQCGALARITAGAWPQGADNWQALRRGTQRGDGAAVRFAVLFAPHEAALAQTVCRHWKVPKAFAELARLSVGECGSAASLDSADGAFELIERCDALRRPQRFHDLLSSCIARGCDDAVAERLREALARASTVTAQPFVAAGLQGEALGRAIVDARRKAVRSHWA